MRRMRFGAGGRKGHDLADTAGEGPAFPYAGQPMRILAGHGGQPPGFAAMEITVPQLLQLPISANTRQRRLRGISEHCPYRTAVHKYSGVATACYVDPWLPGRRKWRRSL